MVFKCVVCRGNTKCIKQPQRCPPGIQYQGKSKESQTRTCRLWYVVHSAHFEKSHSRASMVVESQVGGALFLGIYLHTSLQRNRGGFLKEEVWGTFPWKFNVTRWCLVKDGLVITEAGGSAEDYHSPREEPLWEDWSRSLGTHEWTEGLCHVTLLPFLTQLPWQISTERAFPKSPISKMSSRVFACYSF